MSITEKETGNPNEKNKSRRRGKEKTSDRGKEKKRKSIIDNNLKSNRARDNKMKKKREE